MTASSDQTRELYERAAQVATDGQWPEAATLLERCCKLTGYASAQLNSQWMVAADRARESVDLPQKALELARQAWKAGSRNGALGFIQLALLKNPQDGKSRFEAHRCVREWLQAIATAYPTNAAPIRERGRKKLRIGHLVGVLNPTHAPTKLIKLLASQSPREEIDSFIYSSEWASAWFHNWTHFRQSGPDDFLNGIEASSLHVHEAQGDFIVRARELAEKIRRDDIDVLVVHSSIIEMVTALVALQRPARRLINVNHASEMNLPCFDGAVHMFENGLRRTVLCGIRSVVIPPASDMHLRLNSAPRISREALGIPVQATVSGTFGSLYKIDNSDYTASLRGILKANPDHHHLIAGGGDDRSIRGFLNNAGLADRVHILGSRTDIPSLLMLLDFYLASHPYPGALSEIEAMAASCPVISVRNHPESHFNAGAEVVGLPECIVNPADTFALVELASRYIHDPELRRSIGNRLKERFMQHFTPAAVVAHHMAFYRSVLESASSENLTPETGNT